MPTRPIQHELENESRIAFESLVRPWVYRPKVPDYGIDGEVELFDPSGKASGLQFLVQLKAKQKAANKPSISLSIEWIKYYQSLELPVLVVLWLKESGGTYWRWANELDLYYAKPKAKAFTVHLPNEWDNETPAQLQRHIEFRRRMKAGNFDRPLPISINAPGRPGVHFHFQHLCTQAPSLVSFRADTDVKCSVTKDEVKISFSGYYGAVLHSNLLNVEDAAVARRVFVGVTIALDYFGAGDRAAELWTAMPDLVAEVISQEIAWRVLSILARAGAYGSLRAALRALSSRFKRPDLTVPLYPLYFTAPPHRRRDLAELLIELGNEDLKQETNAEGRSILHYSLGRLWESIEPKKGRKHLVQAIRASSFYADKAYFWRELGSLLFNRSRYGAALRCYEHAYKTLGETKRKSRYGDALMHAGRYGEALLAFEEIAKNTSHAAEDTDEAHLDFAEAKIKGYALNHLKELYGITSQHRQSGAARECMGQGVDTVGDATLARCENGIRRDALFSKAWFDRGITLLNQGKTQEALASFLVAGATNTSDDAAWLNALMLAVEKKELAVSGVLLTYLMGARRSSFIRSITESAQTRSNEKERAMLMELAQRLAEQFAEQQEEAEMRFHGPTGTEIIKGPVR